MHGTVIHRGLRGASNGSPRPRLNNRGNRIRGLLSKSVRFFEDDEDKGDALKCENGRPFGKSVQTNSDTVLCSQFLFSISISMASAVVLKFCSAAPDYGLTRMALR